MRKREFAMEIRTVTACYFSPTDTTKKTVEAIARGIRPVINILDLTLPSARPSTTLARRIFWSSALRCTAGASRW